MEILITAGGTEESIDGVRTITNFSTGRTGASIAEVLAKEGFKVTLLTSRRGVKPEGPVKVETYQSFADLDSSLKRLLETGEFRGVIHAAAVSDYSVDYIESRGVKFKPLTEGKLDSSRPITITLMPNFKIIERIKEYSRQPLILIGFKLTKNGSPELIKQKVDSVLASGKVDYVVQNDLSSINETEHPTNIYSRDEIIASCRTKDELALFLAGLLRKGEVK